MEDVIDADANVNADVDVSANKGHGRHYKQGILDSLSLARLVRYILRLLGLYSDYEFEDNNDLLGFLVYNGDITGEEADRVGGIDILGLFRGSRNHGLLSKLINLDAAALSNQYVADEKREMTEGSDDTVTTAVTLLQGDKEKAKVDADADADADVSADVEV
ncbi:hypothetical protein CONCODRAFT_68342 [Conidiobolus coronatus NRRL 28638]|uniref:Uncharacterized protein n=1 Tax=Conidiobolus coronatus (strain ATCC 28846 / CBS 209.66 / NRRL 28638) TaxID=796925 RepID=A0A137PE95_CONC2|nr:hypothetical protein CONCODRAFT_68342 [Conidiobolus coronatus NRRL 28638]|eukprot:KXN73328.1 hypothetical protein CONCODRAFT_68342 [Conidiobolus coronatus NRRL 28638]